MGSLHRLRLRLGLRLRLRLGLRLRVRVRVRLWRACLQSRAYGEHDTQYVRSTRATVLVRSDGLRHSRLSTIGAWYGAWYGDW